MEIIIFQNFLIVLSDKIYFQREIKLKFPHQLLKYFLFIPQTTSLANPLSN